MECIVLFIVLFLVPYGLIYFGARDARQKTNKQLNGFYNALDTQAASTTSKALVRQRDGRSFSLLGRMWSVQATPHPESMTRCRVAISTKGVVLPEWFSLESVSHREMLMSLPVLSFASTPHAKSSTLN